MGVPKKADWREERRKRAWKLKEKGWQQKDIALALGVSEGAVSQWLKRGREGGIEALNAHPPTGMTPRLTAAQKAQIPALLARGAEAYGFRGDVWTASRVARVIEQTFGIHYHRDHVGRLLTRPQAGVDSNPSSEPPSATKKPSSSGPSSVGPPLKKSRAGQRHHRLGR
jgi:transposase